MQSLNTGANGHGIAEDKAHTLDGAQGQAVARLYENHGQDSRLTGPLDVAPTVHRKYGTGGNNTPLVARYKNNIAGLVEDDISATLRSCGTATHERKIPAVAVQNYTVRRLTPTECERLQGFPDNWTNIPGASDTGRYKALGNSVAVPCVAWII